MSWCEACGIYGMKFISRVVLYDPAEYFNVLDRNYNQMKLFLQSNSLDEPTERMLIYDTMGIFHHDLLTIDLSFE